MNGQEVLRFSVRLQSIKDALHREQRMVASLDLPLSSFSQKESLVQCLGVLCNIASIMDLPKTKLSLIRLQKLAAVTPLPLKERVDAAIHYAAQLQKYLQGQSSYVLSRQESSPLNLRLTSLEVLRQKLEGSEAMEEAYVDSDFRKLWTRMVRGCSLHVALAQSLPDIANCYAECLRSKVPRHKWRSYIAQKIYI